jgi:hypothetical protein
MILIRISVGTSIIIVAGVYHIIGGNSAGFAAKANGKDADMGGVSDRRQGKRK